MSKNYNTRTASLRATIADIRQLNAKQLDAKQIKLDGTNIEDIIQSSSVKIDDGREVKTKYDIWEHAAVENEDGSITVKNLYIPDASKWNVDFGEELKINGPIYVDNKDDFYGVSRAIIKNKLYLNDEIIEGVSGSGWGDAMSTTYADIDPENPGEQVASFDTDKIVDGTSLFETYTGESFGENMTHAHCYIESNFDNLKNGELMFGNYGGVPQHKLDFISNLPSLVNGTNMFVAMDVRTFSSDKNGSKVNLDNLEIGDGMFDCTYNGQYIHDQIEALPKLKSADYMFGDASSPSKWTISLPSLENGYDMFGMENGVTEFYSDLPKLKNGLYMLYNCEKFRGSLPSLENGYCMFGTGNGYYDSGLDSESLLCIVETLPSRVGLTNTGGEDGQGYITITLACDDTDESRDAFVQEVGWDNWQQMYDELTHATEGKNWTAQFSFAGSPTASYSLRNPKPISKVWAKLEEVIIPTDEEIREARKNRIIIRKPYWTHTSADGKHFVLHTHHMSNDNTGYTQFDSLEAAEEHYGLKEKETSE